MAERGFGRFLYVDDDGRSWAVSVDRDSAADPNRGWVAVTDPSLPALPRGFLPRRVVGVDETGRQQSARVATTAALLWTGGVSTFVVEATDGTLVTVTVTTYQAERVIAPGRLDPN